MLQRSAKDAKADPSSPVEANEDGDSGERGQAAGQRVDAGFLVQLCNFNLHLLLWLALVLGLHRLDAWLQCLHRHSALHLRITPGQGSAQIRDALRSDRGLTEVCLLLCEGEGGSLDEDGEQDDGKAVRVWHAHLVEARV